MPNMPPVKCVVPQFLTERVMRERLLALDHVPGQPGKAQAAADKSGGRGEAAYGPALFCAQPTHVAGLLSS